MPQNPHRHQFTTNAERTERKCSTCGAKQMKVGGKWKPYAEPRHGTKQLPDGTKLNVTFYNSKEGK